jgi:hypothetical protein
VACCSGSRSRSLEWRCGRSPSSCSASSS